MTHPVPTIDRMQVASEDLTLAAERVAMAVGALGNLVPTDDVALLEDVLSSLMDATNAALGHTTTLADELLVLVNPTNASAIVNPAQEKHA